MRICKLVELAVAVVPIPAWRDFWIRRHIMSCPECRSRLAGREEVRALFVRETETGSFPDFKPAVRRALAEPGDPLPASRPGGSRRRWRTAGAAVVAAGALILIIGRLRRPPSDSPVGTEGFRLHEIRIENRPARAYLFQPKGSNIVFVWAEKTREGG